MREGSGSGSDKWTRIQEVQKKYGSGFGSGSATLLATLFAVPKWFLPRVAVKACLDLATVFAAVPGEGGGSAVLRAAGHVTPLHALVLLLHQVISKQSVTSSTIG